MTDWDLVQSYVQEGSEEAFRELVRRHADLVFSATLRLCHNEHGLAEDAMQKTFCIFAQKAGTIRGEVALAGWLYRTAVNTARDAMRAERRRIHYERQAPFMETPGTASELKEQFNHALDTALSLLPENERLPILLRFFQQKTMREVGETLGINEDAAKMRVSRSLEKLRVRFAKIGFVLPAAALAALLSETTSNASATSIGTAADAALRSAPAFARFSLTSRILFMTATKKLVTVGVLLLIGAAITFNSSRPGSETIQHNPGPRTTSTQQDVKVAEHTSAPDSVTVDDAVLNLRDALYGPLEGRKIPFERVDRALAAFAGRESAAIPILLEAINKPRQERSFTAFFLAAYGLEKLGTKASSALPDVLHLVREGDLSVLNDRYPKLLQALSPDGAIVPDLIDALKTQRLVAASLGQSINKLIDANPNWEMASLPLLRSLLQDGEPDVQRNAACVLARLPTQKDPAAIDVLIGALNLEKVRDPKAYDPVVLPDQSTTIMRDGEHWADDNWRLQAIQALQDFGPGAKEAALPALREIAEHIAETNQYKLHEQALIAIATLDPETTQNEAGRELAQDTKYRALAEKAKSGTATFDELVEGLRDYRSVGFAAEQLASSPQDVKKAVPQLQEALDRFDAYDAAQALKQFDPDLLIGRLKEGNRKGLYEVASALGELGPSVAYAVPYLEKLLAEMKTTDPDVLVVGETLRKINPGYPKPLFFWDDLHEAMSALVQEIYRTEKIRSPVYDAYIREMQDYNHVPRPALLKFIETTKTDPDLHRVFMDKLIQKNPALGVELQDRKITRSN